MQGSLRGLWISLDDGYRNINERWKESAEGKHAAAKNEAHRDAKRLGRSVNVGDVCFMPDGTYILNGIRQKFTPDKRADFSYNALSFIRSLFTFFSSQLPAT